MRVGDLFNQPESSFLLIEKDFELIFNKMLKNPRLLKLLHYRQKNALHLPNLTPKEKLGLLGSEVRIVPKLDIQKECPIFVVITFDNFVPNAKNSQYRDCTISFDILCHPDHWILENFQLRPYKIAGELDAMFNNSKMTGIGTLEFLSANNLVLNDQLVGLTLIYRSVQSTEDTIPVE